MKLEVGMYVRTKRRTLQCPQIARIRNMSKDSGYKNQYYIELDKNLIPSYEYHIYKEDILKASHNIIDLIEEGDYVNGCKVIDFMYSKEKKRSVIVDSEIWGFDAEEIKSIVTKEMFSNISYEVSK